MRIWILGLAGAVVACGGSATPGFGSVDGGGSSSGGSSGGGSSSGGSSSGGFGSSGGGSSSSGGNGGPPLIYAHTDTELYSMDPTSHQLTDIGPFTDGSGSLSAITDLAVDGNDNVWVNSETAIYKASVPTAAGPVQLTLQTSLPSGSKFFALGFTPAGVLGSGESLVAGDSLGHLYYVDTSSAQSIPLDLGGFGAAPSGGNYELSGDVVFYTQGGTARGLATIRTCKSSTSCSSTDDALAEIDVPAMQQAFQNKSAAPSLRKQLIGSGTGFGRLFGIGAWGNSVYAFSRASGSSNQAQLVEITSTGTGSSLQSFPNITAGWSGAGVTTKAQISVLQ